MSTYTARTRDRSPRPPDVLAPPQGSRRLFAAAGPALAQHAARFGPLPTGGDAGQLIELVQDAGLRGRGGAGFPTAAKMAAITGRRGVVIANGAEGEPLSSKDTVLLQTAPHLVLDGLALAAVAIGARQLHLYAAAASLPAVHRALQERRARGWEPGAVALTEAPETFLAGEETAAINQIAGRPALPSDRRIRVTDSGLRGRPTLVQNVETLAHLALVARYGSRWYRSIGTPTEPGTTLVTLSAGAAPRVLEVPLGMPLDRLLRADADLDLAQVRAVLLGGFHGTWIPCTALRQAALSQQSLGPLGAGPGAGIVHVLGVGECGLQASADIATYLAEQGARQCGPCRNGLPALADVLTQLAHGRPHPDTEAEVLRLTRLVEGRGSCKHPDGTARFIRSALTAFRNDVELHLRGRCEATVTVARPSPERRW